MTDELSPAERELAGDLARLGDDPSPAARSTIMQAVRSAVRAETPVRRWRLRWRLAGVALAALLVLVIGAVGGVAASSQALPNSPGYPLRYVGEAARLAASDPVGREHLRIKFARDRFSQAQQLVRDNRADAKRLVADGSDYLNQAQSNLPSLSVDEQGQVENELDQAGQEESAAQDQVNQSGEH
jgi:hypothetical protein